VIDLSLEVSIHVLKSMWIAWMRIHKILELLIEPQLHEDDREITGSNIDPRCTEFLLKLLEDLALRITDINRDLAN